MSGQPRPRWQQPQQPQYYQQPQYPPQYPPQQMWYPPIQQPPKNDSKIVAIVVVVVVLVVVVPVILGTILYVMVSGMISSGPPYSRPIVTFSSIMEGGSQANLTAIWSVAVVSESTHPFSSFRAQIAKDGAPLASNAQALYSNHIIPFGSSTVKLIARDLAGEGKLTGGDTFLVYGMDNGHNWIFSLIWSADGSALASKSWST